MNKYELALVVSAKVEDEVRDAVVDARWEETCEWRTRWGR